ncbi:MAG: RNA-directed DNA polymerase, partial [Gammaproteobacteria bacterium]|nr:RNA-directed DNA polymerase [Gammaproteobacteria bacterium]
MKLTLEREEKEKQRKTEANLCIQKEGLYDGRADTLVEILPIGENATEMEKERVREIVREYNDVFAVEERELGDCNIVEVEIDTGEAKPIAQPLRRTPITVRDKVDQEIAVMMEMGIIQESMSDWASPIVAVSKPDGSVRICVDFWRVNEVTKAFQYPLPRTDEILEKIGLNMGKTTEFPTRPCISTFDLKMGYHQLRIKMEDAKKTAFRTPRIIQI